MIVIRFLDDNNNLNGDQDIYCNDPCKPNFEGWLGRIVNNDEVQFEIYSNSIVEHDNFEGVWPTISDFISTDTQEYCKFCYKQLNIFDEDLQRFRPRTETDKEIVSDLLIIDGYVKGSNINLNKFY